MPVMTLARDGPQTGYWQYALENQKPCLASLSMLGVMAWLFWR